MLGDPPLTDLSSNLTQEEEVICYFDLEETSGSNQVMCMEEYSVLKSACSLYLLHKLNRCILAIVALI